MAEVTQQEIMATQGTRLSEKAPWETYNASFEEKLDPRLEDEIKRYSEHVHEKSSSQNEEELHRQKEINNQIAKEYQWVSPDEYKDAGARIGHVLTSSEFISLLRSKCHVDCWYRQHPQPGKATLLYKKDSQAPEIGCWIQLGFMPEYSVMRFDEHGVPLDEKFRGWRTCLLQLILKGVVSEDLASKVFGTASGPVSSRFLGTLHGFRNRRFAIV